MLASALLTAAIVAAAPPPSAFQQHVRPTDPLTPAQQQATFHLPKGFRVELVAAEPQIYKPMNLAFDSAGRLWVSESIEYPYAAKEGAGRDRIQVLEDSNGDGRFDKTTTFVDGLNIPIGLLPYKDGVIAYSIPNIYFFRDTDGDGKCDERKVLYGPLGQPRDTHGMQNAFRRGFDGWIYVCHGFSNTSTIKARDGSEITLQSGNTYRIRPDGERVEQFTWGQVNPFGSTFTPWGDLITADCHSKPLTLLLRGGYYSSFGKPHDGIGFVPPMMDHLHGSTAIAGAAHYSGDHFPEAYQGKLFVGNVVTSRVNCDRLEWSGATAKAIEQEDFVRSDDPWFRPVDVQVGPDGALYIADFYNRIIGHYEVPLDHPGRDRHRGRIWRIVYDPDGDGHSPRSPNLAKAGVEELIATLDAANLGRAKSALDELTDRIGQSAAEPLRTALDRTTRPQAKSLILWALFRLGALTDEQLVDAYRSTTSLALRSHVMRMVSESASLTDSKKRLAFEGLRQADPRVARAAADALGQHDDLTAIAPLLKTLRRAGQDPYLQRTLQIAIRNLLRRDGGYRQPTVRDVKEGDAANLAQISLAVPTPDAGEFLLKLAKTQQLPEAGRVAILGHIAAQLPPERIDELVGLVRDAPMTPNFQESLLLTIEQKLAARGVQPTATVKRWASDLATQWIRQAAVNGDDWKIEGMPCWDIELRDCEDGLRKVPFLSSLPGGERAQSTLTSKTFKMPENLSFYLCGHRGHPEKPAEKTTFVALKLVGGEVIASAYPPRNDVARKVEWSFPAHVGKDVQVIVYDHNTGGAYAWLAVSRFEPELIAIPKEGRRARVRRLEAASRIVGAFRIKELEPELQEIVLDLRAAKSGRLEAGRALTRLRNDAIGSSIIEISALPATTPAWNAKLLAAAAGDQRSQYETMLSKFMQQANRVHQRNTAITLASSNEGAEMVLKLVEQGMASPRLLQIRIVEQRMFALGPKAKARIEKLTAGLPPLSLETQAKIKTTVDAFRGARHRASVADGKAVFARNCQACHQVGGEGKLIGPQLDGIGNRGVARIAEDLLDPNRNVDAQFRSTTLALGDGRIVSGLIRRREGGLIILADNKGKEFSVAKDEIDAERPSTTSLMPANISDELKPDELRDLLAYLASLKK